MNNAKKRVTTSEIEVKGHSIEELLIIIWAMLNNYDCDMRLFMGSASDAIPNDIDKEARIVAENIIKRFKDRHKQFHGVQHKFMDIATKIIEDSCNCGKSHEFSREYIMNKYGNSRRKDKRNTINA